MEGLCSLIRAENSDACVGARKALGTTIRDVSCFALWITVESEMKY